MAINQSVYITTSVGMLGYNILSDVKNVQTRLNELMSPNRRKLIVDGMFGNKTGLAITQFQRYVCDIKWPDGLIETNKTTIRFLNDPNSSVKWARSCSISDVQIDQFVNLWNLNVIGSKLQPEPINIKNKLAFERLKQELLTLEQVVKKKYPKGKPDGLGVLAYHTPGKGTSRNLTSMTDTIREVQKKYGQGWACVTALVSTVTVPFLIVYGMAEDSARTIYELAFEPEVHGNPEEYNKLIRNINALKIDIDKID